MLTSAFKAIVSCQVGKAKWLLIQLSTYLGKIEAYFQIKFSRACTHEVSYERKNYGY